MGNYIAFRFTSLRPVEADWAWQHAARCRTSDPELFFSPDYERGQARRARLKKAKQICAQCPVLQDCRNAAIRSREGFGVWGGMSAAERNAFLFAASRRLPPGAGNRWQEREFSAQR
jgi:WhiB family transcriptional regulator, redox-sensing transcriptional regulator